MKVKKAQENSEQKQKRAKNTEDMDMDDVSATAKSSAASSEKKVKTASPFPLPLPNTIIGQVFVSGSNEAGQLGIGMGQDDKTRPKRLDYFNDKNIIMVYAGGMHSIAQSSEGKLYSWGCNDDAALGRKGDECLPLPVEGLDHEVVVSVACGDSISIALTAYGRVYTWGTFRDSRGLFGYSAEHKKQEVPTLVPDLKNIVSIACGTNHAVAINSSGKIYTWGVGEQGQLCRKIMSRHTLGSSLKPRAVNFKPYRLTSSKFTKAFCGSYHTFLLHSSGAVFACGLNNYGQLGIGSDIPEDDFEPYPVSGLPPNIVQMAAGEHHSMALDASGQVYVFGRNQDGQLGFNPDNNNQDTLVVKQPLALKCDEMKNVKSIGCACGAYFSYSLTSAEEDNLWMWGYGDNGQLANGGDSVTEPENIDLKGRHVLGVAGGGQHSVFLLNFRDK